MQRLLIGTPPRSKKQLQLEQVPQFGEKDNQICEDPEGQKSLGNLQTLEHDDIKIVYHKQQDKDQMYKQQISELQSQLSELQSEKQDLKEQLKQQELERQVQHQQDQEYIEELQEEVRKLKLEEQQLQNQNNVEMPMEINEVNHEVKFQQIEQNTNQLQIQDNDNDSDNENENDCDSQLQQGMRRQITNVQGPHDQMVQIKREKYANESRKNSRSKKQTKQRRVILEEYKYDLSQESTYRYFQFDEDQSLVVCQRKEQLIFLHNSDPDHVFGYFLRKLEIKLQELIVFNFNRILTIVYIHMNSEHKIGMKKLKVKFQQAWLYKYQIEQEKLNKICDHCYVDLNISYIQGRIQIFQPSIINLHKFSGQLFEISYIDYQEGPIDQFVDYILKLKMFRKTGSVEEYFLIQSGDRLILYILFKKQFISIARELFFYQNSRPITNDLPQGSSILQMYKYYQDVYPEIKIIRKELKNGNNVQQIGL